MKLAIKKASTDVTVYLFIQASNVTTGAGLTGLTFETAGLVASYVRPLASRAALTLATQTVTGAHSDGGFVEVDATNMPGVYRLDLSDAVCATGVGSVVVMLKGAANMAPLLLEIQLTDFDLNDASPNVTVADIANNAITAAAIATDAIDADSIKADAITEIQAGLATPTNITAGTITTVTNLTNLPAMPNDWLTASGLKADAVTKIATGVWASATRTLSSFGTLVADIWASATRTLSSFGFTVATNSDANVTAMDGKLDVIDGIVDEILIDTGTTLPAAIIAGSAGSGATAKTYTVTDGSSPISGVHVWITTDLSGTNIIASGYTDDLGEVIFFLDSGTTYYVWRQKSGYTFSNPDTETA